MSSLLCITVSVVGWNWCVVHWRKRRQWHVDCQRHWRQSVWDDMFDSWWVWMPCFAPSSLVHSFSSSVPLSWYWTAGTSSDHYGIRRAVMKIRWFASQNATYFRVLANQFDICAHSFANHYTPCTRKGQRHIYQRAVPRSDCIVVLQPGCMSGIVSIYYILLIKYCWLLISWQFWRKNANHHEKYFHHCRRGFFLYGHLAEPDPDLWS